MPLQYDVLQLLVNPNVAYLLLLAGMWGWRSSSSAPA